MLNALQDFWVDSSNPYYCYARDSSCTDRGSTLEPCCDNTFTVLTSSTCCSKSYSQYGKDYSGYGAACCSGTLHTVPATERGCCSDADCPACANNVVPKCDLATHTCKCKPCVTNSDCISGYCCKYAIDNANRECVSEGTIYNYGGESYLCDPPNWSGEQTANSKISSIFKIIWNFLVNLFKD